MKQFIASIFPQTIFKTNVQYAAVIMALWTILVLLAQLFTFEKFPAVLRVLGLGDGVLAAICIVLVEFASLPFLLSMPHIGRAARRLSMVCVLLAPVGWLLLNSFTLVAQTRSGLFGSTISVSSAVGLVLSAAWLVVSAAIVLRTVKTALRAI